MSFKQSNIYNILYYNLSNGLLKVQFQLLVNKLLYTNINIKQDIILNHNGFVCYLCCIYCMLLSFDIKFWLLVVSSIIWVTKHALELKEIHTNIFLKAIA